MVRVQFIGVLRPVGGGVETIAAGDEDLSSATTTTATTRAAAAITMVTSTMDTTPSRLLGRPRPVTD